MFTLSWPLFLLTVQIHHGAGATILLDVVTGFQPAQQESLVDRLPPPTGFEPITASELSLAQWLHRLPLKPEGAAVHLYDGSKKANQRAHVAVVDIDVGARNLQQCADAVIRLYAEYRFATGQAERMAFSLTNGQRTAWAQWRNGWRPRLANKRIVWTKRRTSDGSYQSFRHWLDFVFTYAGTHSLTLDMQPVPSPSRVQSGDVFLQGGFPGHAVMVIAVAESPQGNRVFLLAQSYMPAQDIHILRGPDGSDSPWYPALDHGLLRTPDWTFKYEDLHRFPSARD